MVIRRGDIYFADLRPVVGSEQGGIRPVLIIQNDMGNRHSPTVICAAITSKMNKAKLPTHIALEEGGSVRLGIRNVNKRCRILYGEECGLTIKSDKNGNTVSTIMVKIDNAREQ